MASYAATVCAPSTLNTHLLYKSHRIHNSSPPTRLIHLTFYHLLILRILTPYTPCPGVGHRRVTHKTHKTVGGTGHGQSHRIPVNSTRPATAQATTHCRVQLRLPPPRPCTITMPRRIQQLTPPTAR